MSVSTEYSGLWWIRPVGHVNGPSSEMISHCQRGFVPFVVFAARRWGDKENSYFIMTVRGHERVDAPDDTPPEGHDGWHIIKPGKIYLASSPYGTLFSAIRDGDFTTVPKLLLETRTSVLYCTGPGSDARVGHFHIGIPAHVYVEVQENLMAAIAERLSGEAGSQITDVVSGSVFAIYTKKGRQINIHLERMRIFVRDRGSSEIQVLAPERGEVLRQIEALILETY